MIDLYKHTLYLRINTLKIISCKYVFCYLFVDNSAECSRSLRGSIRNWFICCFSPPRIPLNKYVKSRGKITSEFKICFTYILFIWLGNLGWIDDDEKLKKLIRRIINTSEAKQGRLKRKVKKNTFKSFHVYFTKDDIIE